MHAPLSEFEIYSSMVSAAGRLGLTPKGRRLLPDFVFSDLTRAARQVSYGCHLCSDFLVSGQLIHLLISSSFFHHRKKK